MMSDAIYGEDHRRLQDDFDSRAMADRLTTVTLTPVLTEDQQAFVASRDMVFLTSVDHRGFPTCSYKGGDAGFVAVQDESTLILPSYDGNGMYLSAGNVDGRHKVGLLFIDFEQPRRLRVHGLARLIRDPAALARHPGAELLMEIKVVEVFLNCPRYIHQYQRVAASPFTPAGPRGAEVAPWKNLDFIRDAIPARDQARLEGVAPMSIEALREAENGQY